MLFVFFVMAASLAQVLSVTFATLLLAMGLVVDGGLAGAPVAGLLLWHIHAPLSPTMAYGTWLVDAAVLATLFLAWRRPDLVRLLPFAMVLAQPDVLWMRTTKTCLAAALYHVRADADAPFAFTLAAAALSAGPLTAAYAVFLIATSK